MVPASQEALVQSAVACVHGHSAASRPPGHRDDGGAGAAVHHGAFQAALADFLLDLVFRVRRPARHRIKPPTLNPRPGTPPPLPCTPPQHAPNPKPSTSYFASAALHAAASCPERRMGTDPTRNTLSWR